MIWQKIREIAPRRLLLIGAIRGTLHRSLLTLLHISPHMSSGSARIEQRCTPSHCDSRGQSFTREAMLGGRMRISPIMKHCTCTIQRLHVNIRARGCARDSLTSASNIRNEGFQLITWKNHASNSAVIVPKLKTGFITTVMVLRYQERD